MSSILAGSHAEEEIVPKTRERSPEKYLQSRALVAQRAKKNGLELRGKKLITITVPIGVANIF